MTPKVEISDDTIAKLVKDHLGRQSDERGVRRHVKRNAGGYARLVAALGALTVAINGYAELSKQSAVLGDQNALAFQALATKVNSMAERMAYMQGRLDGLRHEEAEDAVELKLEEFDVDEEVEDAVKKARVGSSGSFSGGGAGDFTVEEEPEVAAVTGDLAPKALEPLVRASRYIQIDAFEQLPEDIGELIQVQEQIQEQIQGEL